MKITVRDISQIALFTALTAVGAFIKIPIPIVPITLQVFFVSLSGVLLGSKKGAISQLLYVLIGLAGFPIFTQGGGIAYVLKPTFGYLIGFILEAYVTGLIAERIKARNIKNIFLSILSGVGIMYVIGVAYLYLINNYYLGKEFSLWFAFYYGFLLCIGGDLIGSYFASVLCYKLLPIIKR
ncbi:MAG: biotin transporter BioY [Clostridiaceae bacterium]|jgi:biotin transport system substrate-specific component|nr:biotin transporter BioY [Clostridiaceae bacterium]